MGVTAMMMKTAGGPGLISPLDYGERKTRLNKNTWIAIGVVAMAHVGVGAALYYQRFEMETTPVEDAPPMKGIVITLPEPVVQKPVESRPVPPNMPVHPTPTPVYPTTTITAVPGESPTPSTTYTFNEPVETPVVDVAPTPPAPRPPAVITSPRWASQPSAAQMSQAYPDRALDRGISGSATLMCAVSVGGVLSGCTVTAETPGGQGFGRAASSLTRFFRMSPGMVDGQAVDGVRVSFTVRFAAPTD